MLLSCDQVYCETISNGGLPHEPYQFKVAYDKLVIAAGSEPLTFGIKGVKEHAFFLREVNHAQEIRKKLLLNLMLSENPGEFCYLIIKFVYHFKL
jgi:NADH:ubiquinone reductase (non-electrogenic)